MLEQTLEDLKGPALLVETLEIAQKFNTAFQWIPSHVDIEGNEIADQLANMGLSDNAPILENQLLLKDAFNKFESQALQNTKSWFQEYSDTDGNLKGKTFRKIYPEYLPTPWYHKRQLEGNEIRLINRLMTGHDYSKYWLGIMKMADDGECDICQAPETAEHAIIFCPKYNDLRSKYSFELKLNSLTDLLKLNDTKLFQEVTDFVKKAKLNL
ncbi:uncharacterized protein LOC129760641 [Uranotaenia lowii]|uniref:uncharacterized protein LOC129760641 n=1 Tax=Uranotaenia lowii TaxID=190385 RepID=UPI00247A8A4E|nr:uncharacterized protein LOC129760641 [Uranotaenia lowii]